MQFELKRVSTSKLIICAVIGAVVSVVCGMALGVILDNGVIGVTLILLFSVLSFLLAQEIASTISIVSITETSIQLDNHDIGLESITGYFINENLTMSAISIKLKSNAVINITALVVGKYGKQFKEFMSRLKNILDARNNSVNELPSEVYAERAKSRKTFDYFFLIPLIVILDSVTIYIYLTKHYLPWQSLLFNVIFVIRMIPYLIKRKT